MLILSGAPFADRRLLRMAMAAGLLGMLSLGCRSEHGAAASEADIVTRIEMLRPAEGRTAASAPGVFVPAGADVVAPSGAPAAGAPATAAGALPNAELAAPDSRDELAKYCRQVELQARDTNASLPKRLDRDTSATRVVGYGCDVVLEYAMLNLRVGDVALAGVKALRDEVLDKLCSDAGARGVLNHGGSFTNVYRDEQSALIDQFTIAEADCWQRSADGAPARVGL